ncbi:hypothetical protein OOK31_04200 [Streptomyces sp. NBC_00249]|nr:hypothetical protein [Streptomyces sp. NBC_00249]MCX5193100.1 hypothetical protein [Streptomyces sp. NBC_00249]
MRSGHDRIGAQLAANGRTPVRALPASPDAAESTTAPAEPAVA